MFYFVYRTDGLFILYVAKTSVNFSYTGSEISAGVSQIVRAKVERYLPTFLSYKNKYELN